MTSRLCLLRLPSLFIHSLLAQQTIAGDWMPTMHVVDLVDTHVSIAAMLPKSVVAHPTKVAQ